MMNEHLFILCIISLCVSNCMQAMSGCYYDGQQYPLHKAVVKGNTEQVNQLIKNNADVNQPDNTGRTPLHRAVENGHKAIVQILLDHHANVNQTDNIGNNTAA